MSFYASGALPWTVSEDDEDRFRRILKRILVFFLLMTLIWPWLPVPKIERNVVLEVPQRLAKLVLENRRIPPPPPVEVKAAPEVPTPEIAKPKAEVSKPQKQEIVKPPIETTKRTEVARKKAAHTGLLALSDDLADLRDNAVSAKLNKELKPGPGLGAGTGPGVGTAGKGPAMGEGARNMIALNATKGSGGIAVSNVSQGTGGGGLAGRAGTQVNSPIGGGAGGGGGGRGGSGGASQGSAKGGGSGRSEEEIRLVLDRNKGAIQTIYRRALREDAGLQGKFVFIIKISPSGTVTDCQVLSSDLRSPELERKLVARIKQFDFGAKSVNITEMKYWYELAPS
ncbi:MAG: AgmX/PglI C-terminal domain-containing protein [Gammaproteobacteria bacterium]|nr:AgmX/PglI C-terminal domain-containing protein [Gammaproteobacteria bacterium]